MSANNSFAESGWRFKAASDVPRDQQNTLRKDVDAFSKMPFVINDEHFNMVLGLKGEVKPKDLIAWLALRAKYLVGETYEMSEKDSYVANSNYSYQYPGILPDIPKSDSVTAPSASPENTPSAEEPQGEPQIGEVMTIMSNVGSSIYLTGKTNGILLGINMPGLGKIPVTSPRVGLLKIGKGLFRMGRTKNTFDIDNSLMRVSTLFHEARHSDGNKKSTGFLHTVCPADHEYAGFYACDFSINGAYSVSFYVGQAMAENCAKCTVAQREALRLDYLDSLSRVITRQEVAPGTEEEIATLHTLKDTCKTLLSYGAENPKVMKMCSGLDEKILKAETKQTIVAPFLDANPEGKL
jgi:hypothetical protein